MNTADLVNSEYPLLPGESPIENAPSIQLGNGGLCIPQQYLLYQHTRESVENIVLDIEYSDRYPIFVCEDDSGLYIQIGIVGYDNYASRELQSGQKVVYGRKWRVESQLPTSEIIQTIFLALKKAREHEVRELFRFHHRGGSTTPFNTHHDLPLISQNADILQVSDSGAFKDKSFDSLKKALELVSYDFAKLELKSFENRSNGTWIVDIEIIPGIHSQLPEVQKKKNQNVELSLMLKSLSVNEVYYQIMDEFLSLSDRHVDESFRYKGFARFSRNNSILDIAELSSLLRRRPQKDRKQAFEQAFETANYETDKTRVPTLNKGMLSDKIRTILARFGPLGGLLPR